MMRIGCLSGLAVAMVLSGLVRGGGELESKFRNPPDSARPGVYWYFMDGNMTREGMTADLEAMRDAGIGNLIFLEVNVGVPRGSVEFMSEPWQRLFKHAVQEAKRLGIEITMNAGPGWTGSGGPWVPPAQSMQHLVASEVEVTGPVLFEGLLPIPRPRPPYFGEEGLSDAMRKAREEYYKDVAVLAVPAVGPEDRLADSDEKALYRRDPYTSVPGVKPYLPEPPSDNLPDKRQTIGRDKIIDLTGKMQPDGRLIWQVPAGKWTLLRFGCRDTGANTRPAPIPGLGFECDKFDAAALDAHFETFFNRLLRAIDQPPANKRGGWTMLHIDSWEMGSQNWTAAMRQEFTRRRGYDPLPFLPVWTGRIIDSPAVAERFLWDLRLTAQELVIENHAEHLKAKGRQHGFGLSIEPYDMNPVSDLELGSVADVPMCEFWSNGFGFDSSFSCVEAASIARTLGRPVVAAEAFTAEKDEAWKMYPGVMKDQGDWAFCMGVNRFVFHTFAHKPSLTDRPGMTMGPYGVHWDRTQTWWPMAGAYHRYLTRCQYLLRQGRPVADVLYLIAEGSPHVFRPPSSALEGPDPIRDRRGYNFDGCTPETLNKAVVRDGRIILPGGGAYRLLVLPDGETMRPKLLNRIKTLIKDGATVVGRRPLRSPSLSGYPQCDQEVLELGRLLWGQDRTESSLTTRDYGKGKIISGVDVYRQPAKKPQQQTIRDAHWIWYSQDPVEQAPPPGTWYFRRAVAIDPERTIVSANMEITADNDFELWVNGRSAGKGGNFTAVHQINITGLLHRGDNWLAVAVTNTGQAPNPAGLIAALHVEFGEENASLAVLTDTQWQAAHTSCPQWQIGSDGGQDWPAVKVMGPFEMAPWNLSTVWAEKPELYPHYKITAALLDGMGLPPDFSADQPVRYIHRCTDNEDIYFVANKQDETITAICRFRVTGRQPYLWDPLTGQTQPLRQYRQLEKTTEITVRFDPHQSFFVVFNSKRPSKQMTAGRDFPQIRTEATIDGSWQVTFDPDYGGPKQSVTFDSLTDWSTHDNPAIRYYSGRAVYRTTFKSGDYLRGNQGRLVLHLGRVYNLAQVKLNGQDLGVVWCAPWRVDITDQIAAGVNSLEITVANLWPNRLIGDKIIAEDQKITRTNYNPYRPTDTLLPSGLLGPVTIEVLDFSL